MDTGKPHRRWINEIPNDGLIRYLMVGNVERVMLTNPKAIGEALVSKSYDYKKPGLATASLGRLLGVGVLLAEGDEHRRQRKNLMPAFHYRHIKDLVPTFWSLGGKFVRAITKEIKETASTSADSEEATAVVQFDKWINRATLDIIGVAGMGCDFGAIDNPNNELSVTYRRIFAPSKQARYMGLIALFIPFWVLRMLPLQRNLDVAVAAEKIRASSRELIEKKQREIQEKGSSSHKDILSVALESGGFTVENLVDQTMTFLAAGHETTATATQWAMVELAKNPKIQARLREEIREKLPSVREDTPITSDMIDKMPYLNAVCQEVLRVWAPVPFTRREAARDTTIVGQLIPKGTDVVLVPYAVNFSKALWGEDAEEFNPERWMGPGRGNTGGAESAYSNMTFLHGRGILQSTDSDTNVVLGPRSCIGSAFAKHELQCLVAVLVGRFEIELEPKDRKIELESGIVTRPKGGLPLRMKVVDGW
jgi:cytochrome P450